MIRLRRVLAWIRSNAADGAVVVGGLAIAYGLGQAPAPWGAMLAPVTVGVALIATVRLGAR